MVQIHLHFLLVTSLTGSFFFFHLECARWHLLYGHYWFPSTASCGPSAQPQTSSSLSTTDLWTWPTSRHRTCRSLHNHRDRDRTRRLASLPDLQHHTNGSLPMPLGSTPSSATHKPRCELLRALASPALLLRCLHAIHPLHCKTKHPSPTSLKRRVDSIA